MASSARGPPGAVGKSSPPSKTLYCRNLPEKLPKEDLKRNLYMLFATYGVVLDVIALKTRKMRGQAHIVFRDLDASMQAQRALQDYEFFGQKMQIQFAKSESHTVKKLLGTFQLPKDEAEPTATPESTTVAASVFGSGPAPNKAKPVNAAPAAPDNGAKGVKRGREEESEQEDEDEEAAMDVSDSD